MERRLLDDLGGLQLFAGHHVVRGHCRCLHEERTRRAWADRPTLYGEKRVGAVGRSLAIETACLGRELLNVRWCLSDALVPGALGPARAAGKNPLGRCLAGQVLGPHLVECLKQLCGLGPVTLFSILPRRLFAHARFHDLLAKVRELPELPGGLILEILVVHHVVALPGVGVVVSFAVLVDLGP